MRNRRALPVLPVGAVLVAMALVGCGVRNAPAPSRTLKFDVSGTTFSGTNGVSFVVLPEPKAGVTRVDVRYGIGSAHDPEGKEGLAHLVEHLLFEVEVKSDGATTSLGAELGNHALYNNAMTTHDYTHYESVSLPDKLEQLLRVEVERATASCAQIRPEVFEREKQVVLSEMRERLGTDGGDLLARINRVLYPGQHPYGRVSSERSIQSITYDDVCSFLVNQYRRGAIIVVISGQVSEERARSLIADHFARIPRRKAELPAIARPSPPAKKTVRLEGDVNEPYVLVAWPMPSAIESDHRLVQIGRKFLMAKFEELMGTYEWGHSAYWETRGGRHAPYLTLTAALTSEGSFDDAISAVKKGWRYANLRRLYGESPESYKWERWYFIHAGIIIRAYESLAGRAHMFAEYAEFGELRSNVIGRLEEIRKSHPDRVRELTTRWLDFDRAVVIEIVPQKNRNRRMSLAQVSASTHSKSYGIHVDPREADRSLEIPDTSNLIVHPTRYRTENGLQVVLWDVGRLPLVHGRLMVHSGRAHEPKGAQGLTSFLGMGTLYQESMVRERHDLNTFVDRLIARLAGAIRSRSAGLSDDSRDYIKERLARPEARSRRRYDDRWWRALYGGAHPYGRPSASLASMDELDRDGITSWKRKHMVPSNSAMILAGKFDPELVRLHILKHTDHLSAGERNEPIAAVARTETPAWVTGGHRQDARTLDFEIGFPGNRGIGDDYAARRVLEGILSSKLATLREELALSYGFSAAYIPRPAGGYWMIQGSVAPSRAAGAAEALQQIFKEVAAGRYRGEFVLARRKALSGLLASAAQPQAIADRLTYMARFGLPDDFYHHLAQQIAKTTLEDVHRLVSAEIRQDRIVWGAWGNRRAGRASVVAAKAAARKPLPPVEQEVEAEAEADGNADADGHADADAEADADADAEADADGDAEADAGADADADADAQEAVDGDANGEPDGDLAPDGGLVDPFGSDATDGAGEPLEGAEADRQVDRDSGRPSDQ